MTNTCSQSSKTIHSCVSICYLSQNNSRPHTFLYQELQSGDWTDSEQEDDDAAQSKGWSDPRKASQRIRRLEEKISAARQELIDYRKLVEGRFNLSQIAEQYNSLHVSEDLQPPPRDDDSHYFRSYAENGNRLFFP